MPSPEELRVRRQATATASTGAATTAGSDAHHTCPDTTAMPGTGYLIAAAGAHHVQQQQQQRTTATNSSVQQPQQQRTTATTAAYNSHNSSCKASATQQSPNGHRSRVNAAAVDPTTTASVTNFCPQELCV